MVQEGKTIDRYLQETRSRFGFIAVGVVERGNVTICWVERVQVLLEWDREWIS